jgi:hypothetical protein
MSMAMPKACGDHECVRSLPSMYRQLKPDVLSAAIEE